MMSDILKTLINPKRVYSRSDVLAKDCPVPKRPGIYSWFFKEIPPRVIIEDCIKLEELTLLYMGISPKRPQKNGRKPSRETLQSRIRYHYRGNAYGSTLRLSLGCLLSDQLGIRLRRVGSDKRMNFTVQGEDKLSCWMEYNAFVSWVEYLKPWEFEAKAFASLSLPLNLQGNEHHPFSPVLSSIRAQARANARKLPIVPRKGKLAGEINN